MCQDGYAVVSSDGVGKFEVAFEALAGSAPGKLQPGTVAYIGTGGALPEGADAVVQIENTDTLPPGPDGKKRVRINKAARGPGDDVRAVGSDIRAGAVVLQAGGLVGAAEVGLLATVGATSVQVHQTPHMAVLSTGDEVVEPTTKTLGPGQIRDANRAMLLAAARGTGAQVTDLGIARDTVGQLEACLERAIQAKVDVLITTGGVSMGARDFVKLLLERHATVHFGKVKMKPGKPLTFAILDTPGSAGRPSRCMLVFGLPGNPVSSMVTFNLTVLPAIQRLAGWKEPGLRRVHARTSAAIRLDPERPEYHRVTLHWARPAGAPEGQVGGELVAVGTGGQISSRLLSMRSANALLELPAVEKTLPAGSVVSALLISDLSGMPVPETPASTISAS
ncbi:hypothetical protein WJX72_004182 [[Myrmecia] bisecta]|uniref:Molybdopterin biosynthesis protein CNX1 n=1 Tax=[Myrmecia] bisecta TaxID=41462 RepID=A0AAW1PGN7_9CHLO